MQFESVNIDLNKARQNVYSNGQSDEGDYFITDQDSVVLSVPQGDIRMSDLFYIASTFRTAIEEAIRAGEIREMNAFSIGCCSYASDLLQRYLIEHYGIFTWYMSGR